MEVKLTAPRGTAEKAKSKRKVVALRLASVILAASLGAGGVTLGTKHIIDKIKDSNKMPITEMQGNGVTAENLGLTDETMKQLEQYEQYFSNLGKLDIGELNGEKLNQMLADVEKLHFDVIKEKMAALTGKKKEDIKMYYRAQEGDGKYYTSIEADDDRYGSEPNGILGLGKKNSIPSELSDTILQLMDIEELSQKINNGEISNKNAVNKIKKLHKGLAHIASEQFIMDDRGNIGIVDYGTEQAKESRADREEEER